MEQVKLKNCFCSPIAVNLIKSDFSDDVVHQFELKDFVERGPSGEDGDFVVTKKPVEVDCYHLNKVIAERAKGTDLKSIISRVQMTGDVSLLNAREPIYGDASIYPESRGDALEEGKRTEEILDKMSEQERDYYLELSKMSDEEFTAHLKKLAEERSKASEVKTEQVEEVVK